MHSTRPYQSVQCSLSARNPEDRGHGGVYCRCLEGVSLYLRKEGCRTASHLMVGGRCVAAPDSLLPFDVFPPDPEEEASVRV